MSQVDRIVEDGVARAFVVRDLSLGKDHPRHVEVGGADAELADVRV